MKKLLLFAAALAAVSSSVFAFEIKPGLGYGLLMKPKDIIEEDISGATETKGGINLTVQGLQPVGDFLVGLEAGYLSLWNYDYSDSQATPFHSVSVEASAAVTTIPILLIGQYNFKPLDNFTPYVQAGFGRFKTSIKSDYSMSSSMPVYGYSFNESESFSDTSSDSGMLIGVGGTLPVGDNKLDLEVKYYSISTEGEPVALLSFNVGYCFKIN